MIVRKTYSKIKKQNKKVVLLCVVVVAMEKMATRECGWMISLRAQVHCKERWGLSFQQCSDGRMYVVLCGHNITHSIFRYLNAAIKL